MEAEFRVSLEAGGLARTRETTSSTKPGTGTMFYGGGGGGKMVSGAGTEGSITTRDTEAGVTDTRPEWGFRTLFSWMW